jgi:hypothetical protein
VPGCPEHATWVPSSIPKLPDAAQVMDDAEDNAVRHELSVRTLGSQGSQFLSMRAGSAQAGPFAFGGVFGSTMVRANVAESPLRDLWQRLLQESTLLRAGLG